MVIFNSYVKQPEGIWNRYLQVSSIPGQHGEVDPAEIWDHVMNHAARMNQKPMGDGDRRPATMEKIDYWER